MFDNQQNRIILHSDMNYFYAAVECLRRPEIRNLPVAVGGNEEMRHGIVLAKNQQAKSCGVGTAMTLVEARKRCPDLVVVPPDFPLYQHYSRLAKSIYYQYTDLVEPFGPDEAWLDVSGSAHLETGGKSNSKENSTDSKGLFIATQIGKQIKSELGLTVSIGVSWNKVFAKFGSDYKKPDAITLITPQNYQDIVWNAPVETLLYVGRATKRKLAALSLYTIGDLAREDTRILTSQLGKIGHTLQIFARGEDITPVKPLDPERLAVDYDTKSVGNGFTAPHDINTAYEARQLIYMLSQSVAQRLREQGLKAKTVCVQVRDQTDLASYVRQIQLDKPSNITSEIACAAFTLLEANEPLDGSRPLRSLTVRATDLVVADQPLQLDIFGDENKRISLERLDASIDELRRRYGNSCVRRGVELADELMSSVDIKRDNVVHPVGFFND
ncbi:MAG: DNA polymerase IV [Coriobacteriales bacterium]|jgi:DNA polymerase-4|nr:DNA polymerase IV [Coriobacteriales bacterium]